MREQVAWARRLTLLSGGVRGGQCYWESLWAPIRLGGRTQSVLVTVGEQMGPAVGLNTVLGANEGTALEGAKVTWWVRTRVLGETVGVTNEVVQVGIPLLGLHTCGSVGGWPAVLRLRGKRLNTRATQQGSHW